MKRIGGVVDEWCCRVTSELFDCVFHKKDDDDSMGKKDNNAFQAYNQAAPRCWGSTALSGHNSTRKYWWSFRGIHVDPNAPFTNKELTQLKAMMLRGNFSWGAGLHNRSGNETVAGAGRDGDAKVAPGNDASYGAGAGDVDDPYANVANWTDWVKLRVPPAPDLDGVTEELIDSQVTGQKESSVASFSIMTLLFLLGFTMLFGLWLKHRRVTFLHQAGAALLLGVSGGLVMFFVSLGADQERWIYEYGDYFVFDTEFFFLFLLPPIIFESGYGLNAEPFFRNLGKILYFAFVGTLVGVGVFGVGMYAAGQIGLSHPFSFVNAMMFGSIIGATDPVSVLAIFNQLKVDSDLFAIVFGESVLNDAVAAGLHL